MSVRTRMISLAVLLVFFSGGCEKVYYLLQKEGAEEKKLLGEALPLEANPKVAEVQKLLKLYGYAIGTIDGKIGPGTRNAIIKFQRDNNLEETRFVDKATWDKLHMFERSGLIVNGEVSAMAVQQALTNAGLDVGRVDGKMGPQTKRVLITFQKSNGLRGDGVIGMQTLKLLDANLGLEDEE